MDHIFLPWYDHRAQHVLDDGVFDQTERWVATRHSSDGITFMRVTDSKPSLLWRIFKATRAISLSATVMPALTVLLMLVLMDISVNWGNAITALVAVMLLQVSVNVFNDVADYKKLIDLPDTLGGSGVIQKAWLSAKQMSALAWTALLLAALFAIPSILSAPIAILSCALFALLGVLGYSGWPFYFKYNALGDLVVWLLCGPVMVTGMSFAASGVFVSQLLIVGVYFGFAATAILNANNINDMQVDVSCGAQTLASKLGFNNARRVQVAYYVGVICSLIVLAVLNSYWLLLPVLATPLMVNQLKTLYSVSQGSDNRLKTIRFDAAKLHLLLGVLMSVAIAFDIWLT